MDKRGIAITGLGLATSLGKNVSENWRNLEHRRTGIGHYPKDGPLRLFDYIGKATGCTLPEGMPRKIQSQSKFLNRGSFLGFLAAHEAMTFSQAALSRVPPERRALVSGSGDHTLTGYEFLFSAVEKGTRGRFREIDHGELNEASLHQVNPFYLLESLHNNLFSFLSAFFELKGPNASLASQSPCGLHALESAFRMLRQDQVDMALVVGCGNWITEIPLYELQGLGLLSHCREGRASFRPLDRRRNGFIPGEGGAALILESEKSVRRRGAFVHGRVKATANCLELDGLRGTKVSKKVSLRCMDLALKTAGVDAADLGFISPHGNATRAGDLSELLSMDALLGSHASQVPITALKPYTGHMGAASDIAEIVLGIEALKHTMAPATLNFRAVDEDFSHLRISNTHVPLNRNHFLTVSCGMGGQVASALIEG